MGRGHALGPPAVAHSALESLSDGAGMAAHRLALLPQVLGRDIAVAVDRGADDAGGARRQVPQQGRGALLGPLPIGDHGEGVAVGGDQGEQLVPKRLVGVLSLATAASNARWGRCESPVAAVASPLNSWRGVTSVRMALIAWSTAVSLQGGISRSVRSDTVSRDAQPTGLHRPCLRACKSDLAHCAETHGWMCPELVICRHNQPSSEVC